MLRPLGAMMPVFQWHGCTYDLPDGAVQLARSDSCEQQAFRWGDKAYGFQFHLETDTALIERWLALPRHQEELAAAGLAHDEQAIRQRTHELIGQVIGTANAVFNAFLDIVGQPDRRIVLRSR